MNQGLLMSDEEKALRHEKLFKVVTTHTSHTWAAVLVKMLLGQMNSVNTARMTPYIPKDILQARYRKAKKRLFLFDYDVGVRLVCGLHVLIVLTGNPRAHRPHPKHGHAD